LRGLDLARPHESAAPQSTAIGEHVWDASSVPIFVEKVFLHS
jgi:hypothetical protein